MRRDITLLTLILASILALPFWLALSTKVTIVQGPIKLWEFIHPTYYIGLSTALVALLTLILRRKNNSHHKAIVHPLLVALVIAMYMQLPSLALFQYPFSDHSFHVTPIYWILRNHNIYWPNHLGHPETASPQLTMAILMMITNENSVFTLHRICLLLLSALAITYMYMLSQSIGLTKAYSAATAVLALALTYLLYYFLRQTYTIPIYVLTAYLIVKSIKNRKYLVPLIVLIAAFISMDPAFVLVTILALVAYPMMQVLHSILLKLRGVTENIEIRSTSLVAIISILLFGLYMLWIFSRYPYQPRDLYHIAQHARDTVMRALHEPSTLTPKTPYYWGKPTALGYNQYYGILYRIKVFTRATCMILGAIAMPLILAGMGRRSRDHVKYLLISSYFIVTVIIIVAKAYGAAFAPWSSILSSLGATSLLIIERPKRIHSYVAKILLTSFMSLIILTIVAMPHILTAGGRTRLVERDIQFLSWYAHLEGDNIERCVVSGFGRWLSEFSYIKFSVYPTFLNYLFYEGVSDRSLQNLLNRPCIALTETSLQHFEKTMYVAKAFPWFLKLSIVLTERYNLIYTSGLPFTSLWAYH